MSETRVATARAVEELRARRAVAEVVDYARAGGGTFGTAADAIEQRLADEASPAARARLAEALRRAIVAVDPAAVRSLLDGAIDPVGAGGRVA